MTLLRFRWQGREPLAGSSALYTNIRAEFGFSSLEDDETAAVARPCRSVDRPNHIGLAYKRSRTAVYLHGVESAVGMVVVRLTVPNAPSAFGTEFSAQLARCSKTT